MNIDTLIDAILKLKYSKIITLQSDLGTFEVDVDENGKFGYIEGVKELFYAKLHRAFSESGAIMIRQFLPEKINITEENGNIISVPMKNLYGILIKDGVWISIDKKRLAHLCSFDSHTGASVEKMEDINYCQLEDNL